ncbi:hypothetical protein EC973_001696 [Apophysomyces ossiformis]|uniref:Sucrase/ferredoxin-like-domain-containing protein n=1 Tax=Apophysomyces ossiformis TaxID=679940 RepID=A0A8H7BLR0_9FUNG|nr:hypothetical protein EC973_001696 [Apophysomyces ossiformis]
MDWLSRRVSNLYSCANTCSAPETCLPPISCEPLPTIVPVQCSGCVKPCPSHPVVPAHLKIDQSRPLQNTVPPYAIHLIILTGKTDWAPHIEDEGLAASLIRAIEGRDKGAGMRPDDNIFHSIHEHDASPCRRIVVTNASLPSTQSTQRGGQDVILMPDNVIIANVTPRRAGQLLDFVFGKPSAFVTRPSPYQNLVLICGHGNKDRRCGTVGPMLQKSFQHSLQNADVKDTQVALVSHLGGSVLNTNHGHAFAGNLVVYTHHGQRAIWYGRVTPCFCDDIVHQTIKQDNVIEDLVRGVFETGHNKKPLCSSASLEW